MGLSPRIGDGVSKRLNAGSSKGSTFARLTRVGIDSLAKKKRLHKTNIYNAVRDRL